MKHLFIGGPADGKWLDTDPGLQSVRVPILPAFTTRIASTPRNSTFANAQYILTHLAERCPNTDEVKRYAVFVVTGVPVIESLINGYSPKGN